MASFDTDTARLMRNATYASVATAAVLVVAKLAAFAYTDSVALLSSLIDSLVDALASTVNLLAVRHATMPAAREHRFGHGKAEPLAALAQAMFVAGSGVFLIVEARLAPWRYGPTHCIMSATCWSTPPSLPRSSW